MVRLLMPIGCCSLVPDIVLELHTHQPSSVLDLGVGMGFYGAVVRQWLDNGVREYRTRLVGVEGWAAYCNPCWGLYDSVMTCDICKYLASSTDSFDAILLLDVLEHFTKEDGYAVLSSARRRLTMSGRMYVGTPAVWMEQGAAYGNEYERHRSLWTAEELRGAGFQILRDGARDPWGNEMLLGVGTAAA